MKSLSSLTKNRGEKPKIRDLDKKKVKNFFAYLIMIN